MKDKLVKFHHKKMYYRVKKYSILFASLIAVVSSFVVPLIIVEKNYDGAARAEDTLNESENEDIKEEDNTNILTISE